MTAPVRHRTAGAQPVPPRPRPRRRHLPPGPVLALAGLALMMASDYKVRVRPLGQSLTAAPDLQTLAEIAVYGVVFALVVRSLLLAGPVASAAWPVLLSAWVYATYMCISVVWSVYPTLAVVRGWQFLVAAGLASAVARICTRRDLHLLAHAYVLVVAASVVSGMLVKFPRSRLQADRFTWLHVHPVIAGAWLALAVVLTVWLLLLPHTERAGLPRLPAWAYAVVLGLSVGGLVGTQTRGALGGCAAGIAVLLTVRLRRHLIEVVVLGAAALVVLAMLFLTPVLTFLARGESSSQLTSFNGRTPLWEQAYDLFLARPLVGYGTTAARGLFFDETGLGGAHNAAINVLIDGGLVGVVLWAALLFALVRRLAPLLHQGRSAADVPVIAAALACMAVNGATTEGLGYIATSSGIWLFVLVGWVGVLHRPRSRPRPVPPPVAPRKRV